MSSYFYVNGQWIEFLRISGLRVFCIFLGVLVAKYTHLNLYDTTILITLSGGAAQIFGLYVLRKSFGLRSN
jgi:hypothetical protein